ncbi:hypothetical protein [Acinetobacter sp. ANC 5054]|uniref:hypothetical protein n=2 Tax=Acinetobacter TaxID=469 RepID=UPI001D1743CB|nr:hypothetical protein [Acinetobacter sp. ANC 5054]
MFAFEVCQGFLSYCTKHSTEYDVDAPDRDALNFTYILELNRNFTEDEFHKIFQIMKFPFTVERFGLTYSSHDFMQTLVQTLELIDHYDELTEKELKTEYQRILHKYAMMNADIQYSKKIYTRIRGIRGAHKRYSNVLYKKHQVIFEFMRNKAKEQGKWANLNVAVESVLPQLDIELKKFDKDWIILKMAEKTKELEQIEQEFEKYKAHPPHYKLGSPKTITATRHETYIGKIRALKVECRDLDRALEMDDPSLLLKKQLPFNTAYQPEVIKNLLRKEPSLLNEILIKQTEN